PDGEEIARLAAAVESRRIRVGGRGHHLRTVHPAVTEGDVPLAAQPDSVEGLPVELDLEAEVEEVRAAVEIIGRRVLFDRLETIHPAEGPRIRPAEPRHDQNREGEQSQQAPHLRSHTRRLPTSAPEPGNGKGIPLPGIRETDSPRDGERLPGRAGFEATRPALTSPGPPSFELLNPHSIAPGRIRLPRAIPRFDSGSEQERPPPVKPRPVGLQPENRDFPSSGNSPPLSQRSLR